MYNLTQYILAAIHDGGVDAQLIIDDYENKHKAKVIEIGIDKNKIYEEAKQAQIRNTIVKFLMIFPAFYIDLNFQKAISSLLFIALVQFINQIIINNKLKNMALNFSGDSNLNDNLTTNNSQNVIVSGNYSPFIGYGADLNSWSFTVNLKKPSFNNNKISEINIEELLNFISYEIKRNIPDTLISDKIFVNGKDIRRNPLFMESIMSQPIVTISQEIIDNYIGKIDTHIRHYRHIELPMWNNQVSLSIFIRFTIQGDQLFSEARYFLLSPIKKKLMVLDNVTARSGVRYYCELIFICLFKSTYLWFGGFNLLFSWFSNIQTVIFTAIFGDYEDKIKIKIKSKNETYNYGRSNSIREILSGNDYHRYFQMVDKDQNYKISQYIITNSIVDYLESKGISTEDIKKRQTTIINSGVIVNGGTINSEQMSVGLGAILKNTINKLTPSKL